MNKRPAADSAVSCFWAGVAILAYAYPYFSAHGTWWRAIPSSAFIVCVAGVVFRERALEFLGLLASGRTLAKSVGLLLVAMPASLGTIRLVVDNGPLVAALRLDLVGPVHQFFQVLNDEMVLRAALLTLALKALPRPRTVVLGCAVFFSVAHHVAYRLDGIYIDVNALVSLFCFGALANLLFVRCGHVGYGLALHYGWNLPRFSYDYFVDGQALSEGMSFNYLEGNGWVTVAAVSALATASIVDAANHRTPSTAGPTEASRQGGRHEQCNR